MAINLANSLSKPTHYKPPKSPARARNEHVRGAAARKLSLSGSHEESSIIEKHRGRRRRRGIRADVPRDYRPRRDPKGAIPRTTNLNRDHRRHPAATALNPLFIRGFASFPIGYLPFPSRTAMTLPLSLRVSFSRGEERTHAPPSSNNQRITDRVIARGIRVRISPFLKRISPEFFPPENASRVYTKLGTHEIIK